MVVQQDIGVDAVSDYHQECGDRTEREFDVEYVHQCNRDDEIGKRGGDDRNTRNERPEDETDQNTHAGKSNQDAEKRLILCLGAKRRRPGVDRVDIGTDRLRGRLERLGVCLLGGQDVGVVGTHRPETRDVDTAVLERGFDCVTRRVGGEPDLGPAGELQTEGDWRTGEHEHQGDDDEGNSEDCKRECDQLSVGVVLVRDPLDVEPSHESQSERGPNKPFRLRVCPPRGDL